VKVLIVDADPQNGTRVLEVSSMLVAERLVGDAEAATFEEAAAGHMARGVTWKSYRLDGKRTIVILEVP